MKTKHNKTGVNLYQREVPTSSMKTSTPLAMENLGPSLSDGLKNKVENITIVILSSYFHSYKNTHTPISLEQFPLWRWLLQFYHIDSYNLRRLGRLCILKFPYLGDFFFRPSFKVKGLWLLTVFECQNRGYRQWLRWFPIGYNYGVFLGCAAGDCIVGNRWGPRY